MSVIAIEELYEMLTERLEPSVHKRVEMKVEGDSGLIVKIDDVNCLTSIGVWPNGCCDVNFLYASSEQGQFTHFEFSSTAAAIGRFCVKSYRP